MRAAAEGPADFRGSAAGSALRGHVPRVVGQTIMYFDLGKVIKPPLSDRVM